MNPVGDYLEVPEKEFFEKASASIRVDEDPSKLINRDKWYSEKNLETYRLAVTKKYEKLLTEDVHQKTRNLVYKSEKNNVKTSIATCEEELWIYYGIYVQTMLRIFAIPQSYAFFKAMWKEFHPSGTMQLFLSYHNGKAVSGIVTLYEKSKKRLHIWSNASLPEAREVAANVGTYSYVLKFACENEGIEEVDFGNTEPETSLAFFKSRFGAVSAPIWTVSTKPIKQTSNSKLPAKVLKYMPIGVMSFVCNLLFRFVR